jgi:hypothetical protein
MTKLYIEVTIPAPAFPSHFNQMNPDQFLLALQREIAYLREENTYARDKIMVLENESSNQEKKNANLKIENTNFIKEYIDLKRRIADMESVTKTKGVDVRGCLLKEKEKNKGEGR